MIGLLSRAGAAWRLSAWGASKAPAGEAGSKPMAANVGRQCQFVIEPQAGRHIAIVSEAWQKTDRVTSDGVLDFARARYPGLTTRATNRSPRRGLSMCDRKPRSPLRGLGGRSYGRCCAWLRAGFVIAARSVGSGGCPADPYQVRSEMPCP